MSLDVYLTHDERCPACGRGPDDDVYSANITHNLTTMADAAGLYGLLWRPEENGITKAQQLIGPLQSGIAAMKADRPKFEALNSLNGWGLYENFVPWLEALLEACEENPDCFFTASR